VGRSAAPYRFRIRPAEPTVHGASGPSADRAEPFPWAPWMAAGAGASGLAAACAWAFRRVARGGP
jgi:hypothetical protein